MKHVKNILKVFGIFLIELPLDLSSFIVVPIVLLFCKKEDARLPKYFAWYDDYNYGINGDLPWQGPEHSNGKYREYRWRVRWLLRNRVNTFSVAILGLNSREITKLDISGDIETENKPVGHSGWQYIVATTKDNKKYFCYYVVYQYPFFKEKCFRAYIGWKLKDIAEEYFEDNILHNKPTRERIQFVFAVNPFMSFEQEPSGK